jgi:hypothetical protein
LRVAAGFLLGEEFQKGVNGQLGDGVPSNDVPFLPAFPYVAPPHQGFEHTHHASGAAMAATPEAAREVTVPLGELNGSGISGEALLTETDAGTHVALKVDGPTADTPVHIHFGRCEALGEIAAPLTNIDASGRSDTDVPLTLDEMTSGEYAINAHESVANIANYVACGVIGE